MYRQYRPNYIHQRDHISHADPEAWAILTAIVQQRSKGVCNYSKRRNGLCEPASVVDHIEPVYEGGSQDDLNNLQHLCERCSRVKSQGEIVMRRYNWDKVYAAWGEDRSRPIPNRKADYEEIKRT